MPIQIRFVEGGGWDSKIIRWFTRCCWSHVEEVKEGWTFGAQLKGGVRWRKLNDRAYRKAVAYEVVTIPCTEEQASAFGKFMEVQDGKPYDFRAIISFAFGSRDWREEDSWFCAEIIARGLEIVGLLSLPADIPVDRITPRDLWIFCQARKNGT